MSVEDLSQNIDTSVPTLFGSHLLSEKQRLGEIDPLFPLETVSAETLPISNIQYQAWKAVGWIIGRTLERWNITRAPNPLSRKKLLQVNGDTLKHVDKAYKPTLLNTLEGRILEPY